MLAARVETSQMALAQRARERRALELLRERRRAEHDLARERAEQRDLDEQNALLQARAASAVF
jgi:flagellar export protein FliJ